MVIPSLGGLSVALTRVDEWVNENWLKVLVMLATILGAWFTLRAQVVSLDEKKIDSMVFTRHIEHEDSLKTQILFSLEKIQAEQKRTHDFLCQNHRAEFGCQ